MWAMTIARGAPDGPREAVSWRAQTMRRSASMEIFRPLPCQLRELTTDGVGGEGVGDVEVPILDERVRVEAASHPAAMSGGAQDGSRRAGLEQLIDAAMVRGVHEVEGLGEELVGGDVAVEQEDGAGQVGSLKRLERVDREKGADRLGWSRVGARQDVELASADGQSGGARVTVERLERRRLSRPAMLGEDRLRVVVGGDVARPADVAVGMSRDEGFQMSLDGAHERLRHVYATVRPG